MSDYKFLGQPDEEPTMTLERLDKDFVFNNPVLASIDALTVFAGQLGMVTSLKITSDYHRAIIALMDAAKEYASRPKISPKIKAKITEYVSDLEELYYKEYYWLESRKREVGQTEVLTRRGNEDFYTWCIKVQRCEKEIFAVGGPYHKLLSLMRSLLNNRITQAIDIRRKKHANLRRNLFPNNLLTFTNVVESTIVKKEDYFGSEDNDVPLTIPPEMITRGNYLKAATATKKFLDKDQVRFGVDPFYNIQRDLTSFTMQESAIEGWVHFGRALRILEKGIISYIGPEKRKKLLLIRIKRNKNGEPIIKARDFISLFYMVHELNFWLKNQEKWTIIEQLEILELKRDLICDIEDFISSMLGVFMDVLMRNPNLSSKTFKRSFEDVEEM